MNYSPKYPSKDYREPTNTNDTMALQLCQAHATHTSAIEPPVSSAQTAELGDNRASASARVIAEHADEKGAAPTPIQQDIPYDQISESSIPVPITLNIADHPQNDLLVMLSSLLTKITYSNDNIQSGPEPVSPLKPGSPLLAFHARNIPSISIQSYLTRILKYCPMSSDIFLSLLVYFDRMSHSPGEEVVVRESSLFTSTKQLMGDEHHPLSIDSYNVHRLVITGIVVASKFCSDVFYTNSRYAKVRSTSLDIHASLTRQVGGLPLSELNHLEFQFLLMNDFRLMIPMEELQRYGDQLLNFWHNEPASKLRNV